MRRNERIKALKKAVPSLRTKAEIEKGKQQRKDNKGQLKKAKQQRKDKKSKKRSNKNKKKSKKNNI